MLLVLYFIGVVVFIKDHITWCLLPVKLYGRMNLVITAIKQNQVFMQDTIIASHTCFGGHMDVNY